MGLVEVGVAEARRDDVRAEMDRDHLECEHVADDGEDHESEGHCTQPSDERSGEGKDQYDRAEVKPGRCLESQWSRRVEGGPEHLSVPGPAPELDRQLLQSTVPGTERGMGNERRAGKQVSQVDEQQRGNENARQDSEDSAPRTIHARPPRYAIRIRRA